MRILITGATGQLGQSLALLRPSALEFGEHLTLFRVNRNELNLSSESACKDTIYKIKPDWVINCGAFTAVDKAESDKELAYKVNGFGPYYLSKYLNKIGGKLLHISSDFVFDGKNNKAYNVNDLVNPINVYGESKALGEKLILEEKYLNNVFILRTSWLISNLGNNFFTKMLKLLAKKNSINVVNDQIGCITSASNLSKVCWQLIKLHNNGQKIPKIMHFSDSGICTWFDVAKTIYEYASKKNLIANNLIINPVDSDFLNLKAKRPIFSLLNSQETYDLVAFTPSHWRKSINTLIESLDSKFTESLKKK